jgi:hypothetical protein
VTGRDAGVVYSASKLRRFLEVRSFLDFGQRLAFAEKIVYKDWIKETEVHFDIVETGNPTSARTRWTTLGTTPWAWRYIPLTDDARLPHFLFVLNRRAKLTVTARDKDGREIRYPPTSRDDRVAASYFSEILVRQEPEAGKVLVPIVVRRCVPTYSILRPQIPFMPISARPDEIFELGTTSLLYYTRDVRDRRGEVRTEPVGGSTQNDLRTQISRRYSSTRHLRTDTSKGSEYVISSSVAGHVIVSVEGEYRAEIKIENLHYPADYNFEFFSHEIEEIIFDGHAVRKANWDRIELFVHHGPNVKVEAFAMTRPWVLETNIRVLKELVVGSVGFLGDPLPSRSKFEPLRSGSAAGAAFLYMIGSMALAFVPVWGWIAALALTAGEFVYTYNTRSDFFGQKVTPTEFAALGLLGIAGAVGDLVGAIRIGSVSFSTTLELGYEFRIAFGHVRHEYDAVVRGSVEAVELAGDQAVAKLIASLPPVKQDVLAKLGIANLEPLEYLRRAGELLAEHLKILEKVNPEQYKLIVGSILEELLTPDGASFASDFLRSAYEAYLRNPNTKYPVNPITWMWKSKSTRVSRFLTSVLGPNYRQIIREMTTPAMGKRIVLATEQNIGEVVEFFDTMSALGLVPYKVLDDARKARNYDSIRGLLQDCFQFEHLLELRFARNLDGRQHFKVIERGRVRWVTDPNPLGVNVREEFVAIIAPRTRRHAVLLQSGGVLPPRTGLRYTQQAKTRLTADRIPHGAEHLFTPQEIADQTCSALLELDFDLLGRSAGEVKKMMDRLEGDFKVLTDLINEVRGTRFDYPVLTESLDELNPALTPGGKGWPRVERDNRGARSIINLDEVDKARDDREVWARSRRKKP